MASSKHNVITHGLSGKVGDLVVFRQRFGKTFLGKIPTNSGETSPAQEAVQKKFVKAVNYAKVSMGDPQIKALYAQKAGGGVTPFNLAIADFFTPPVIVDIIASAYTGAAGTKIEVQATDDMLVKTVEVIITAADGSLIEKGDALQENGSLQWFYTATAANGSVAGSKITAMAKDLPGNSTSAEKVL